MTHVVTLNCEHCKYTDCVEVCPTDSFHEGATMLFINPDDCIDCGVCIIECPVDAITDIDQIPAAQREPLFELNRHGSQTHPVITRKKAPLVQDSGPRRDG